MSFLSQTAESNVDPMMQSLSPSSQFTLSAIQDQMQADSNPYLHTAFKPIHDEFTSCQINDLDDTLPDESVIEAFRKDFSGPEENERYTYHMDNELSVPPVLISAAPPNTTSIQPMYSHTVQVQRVIYSPHIPEFPETSSGGVAYVIPVDVLSTEEINTPWKTIQYNHKRVQPIRASSTALFGGVPCMRATYQCTGGKACEFLSLTKWHHESITDEMIQEIGDLRESLKKITLSRQAVSFTRAIYTEFLKGNSCSNFLPSCKLQLIATNTVVIGHTYSFTQHYIQCCNVTNDRKSHYIALCPKDFDGEHSNISSILEGEEINDSEDCYFISSNTIRKQTCEVDHIRRAGRISTRSCLVKFQFFLPIKGSMDSIIITSHGKHCHPPVPPSKIPQRIANDFRNLIKSMKPQTALIPFLSSPEVMDFCRQYSKKSLAEIHASFANQDLLRAVLQKHKALHYPEGSSRMAVYLDYQQELRLSYESVEKKREQYIQFMDDDGHNFMVICFYQAQVEIFNNSAFESLVIDVNYKHLAVTENIEILWGWFNPISQKVIPLVRVFTNNEEAQMFAFMYSKVFSIFKDRFEYSVTWKHIHGSGLIGITADQEYQSMLGFALYLQSCDSERRPWLWHAQRTVKFCKIHFQRGVEKYCNKDRGPSSKFSKMMALLDAPSEEAYSTLIDELENEPGLLWWAKHKNNPKIKFGLNRHNSRMLSEDWDKVPSHTNTVEILHEVSYRWSGRYVALRNCINACRIYDYECIQRDQAYRSTGVSLTYRNISSTGRFVHAVKRKVKKRTQRQAVRHRQRNISATIRQNGSESPIGSSVQNNFDEDIQSVSQASSSGVIYTPRLGQRSVSRGSSMSRASNSRWRELDLQQKQQEVEMKAIEIEKQKLELEERKLQFALEKQKLGRM